MSPNAPRTPHRTFRITDELYKAAQAKATKTGQPISDVVRHALELFATGQLGRDELLSFAKWLLEGEVGEGREEEIVDKYLADRKR